MFAAIAVLAGIIAGLVLAGFLFRGAKKPVDDTKKLRCFDPYLHHGFRPNASGTLRWGRRAVPYFTNSLGFRDRACRQVAKFSGNRRIVALGDSFLEGLGVAYEHTVTGYLEDWYNQDGKPIEVLNGAVASYSPFLEYRSLKRFFESGYRADEIVVFLDISDVQDEAIAEYHLLAENENFHSSVHEGRRPPVRQRFWEVILFGTQEEKHRYYSTRDRWTEDRRLFEEYGRRGVQRCKENLLRIKKLAAANGAQMKIVLYPWPVQIRSRKSPSRYETIFGAFAGQEQIPVINLVPVFRSMRDWQDYFLSGDVHWNEKGHRFVAASLKNEL